MYNTLISDDDVFCIIFSADHNTRVADTLSVVHYDSMYQKVSGGLSTEHK